MTRALYPGTFDPIHSGHIDIASRASAVFDEVVLAIYDAPPKKLLFDTDERMELAQEAVAHLANVTVTTYAGLTIACARQIEASVIVRGLRNVADFEFEHQIGWANHQMAPDIELCCLFCNGEYAYLSATILKEVASLGGNYEHWAPKHVRDALRDRFGPPEPAAALSNISRSDGKLSYRD
ncbi:MAG: pantetheine-phosphate adenylyltransferase [Caldilineaceae bacterium]|nr:pantetheine-phosphate adenylyltransferase [Caldilineaceae bacterium]